jgi:hypothetical protein
MEVAQPLFKPYYRNTCRDDCYKLYLSMKQNLINELCALTCKFSLISDIWTSSNLSSYLCITAHYIDSRFVIQKRIIGFVQIEHPHNANNIFTLIYELLTNFAIDGKIMTITFHNASNNIGAASLLQSQLRLILNGQFFHIRCICHILNLCVQDGLNGIAPQIVKIRNAVLFINTSSYRFQEFKQFCRSFGKRPRKLLQDVPHRWNSTFEMLSLCLDYKTIITSFYNSKQSSETLLEMDWNAATVIRDLLHVFYNATKLLSGSYYPTTNKVLPQLLRISTALQKHRDNFPEIIQPMDNKLKKYFANVPLLYCLALVMDPRFRLSGLDAMLQIFYKKYEHRKGAIYTCKQNKTTINRYVS